MKNKLPVQYFVEVLKLKYFTYFNLAPEFLEGDNINHFPLLIEEPVTSLGTVVYLKKQTEEC